MVYPVLGLPNCELKNLFLSLEIALPWVFGHNGSRYVVSTLQFHLVNSVIPSWCVGVIPHTRPTVSCALGGGAMRTTNLMTLCFLLAFA